MTTAADTHAGERARGDGTDTMLGTFGMWVCLASEIMLFGAGIVGYWSSRVAFRDAFQSASRELDVPLATANTAVLLTSSLTMALAVVAVRAREPRRCRRWLAATAALGAGFLVLKGWSYAHEIGKGFGPLAYPALSGPDAAAEQLFFQFYWTLTGLHALHLLVGVAVVVAVAARNTWTRRIGVVENVGLYWHLIDIVWVFLFPSLYLDGLR